MGSIVVSRLDAARWNNAIDGCYEGPENALVLDAYARGEIDRSEFDRRIRALRRRALQADDAFA